MRPLFLTLPASLLLMASGASAQTAPQAQQYPLTDPQAISQVQVTAVTPPYKFWDYEAEDISGGYAMSNGWRMKVDPASDGIVAQIDKQRPMRLIAMAKDKYVSRDGNVSMEFNKGQYGEQMVMSYVPNPGTSQALGSQAIVVTATLAQR